LIASGEAVQGSKYRLEIAINPQIYNFVNNALFFENIILSSDKRTTSFQILQN